MNNDNSSHKKGTRTHTAGQNISGRHVPSYFVYLIQTNHVHKWIDSKGFCEANE